MPDTDALLVCNALTMRFGGFVALDSLDLNVGRGEFIGIIGPNGSGKTTLFNIITGLLKPASGHLIYDGVEFTGASPQHICRLGITRTFQRSRLCLELSVFDNLMIGNHTRLNNGIWMNLVRRKQFEHELARMAARAKDLIAIFNPALVNRMNEPVGNQPMIDRRRIEICRALMSEPSLLLLDEPSAGMTETEMHRLMENLLQVKTTFDDLTIVLIEHEMSVIESVTNHCVVLNMGKKLCEGAYAKVVSNPDVQTAYLGTKKVERQRRERRANY